MSKTIHALLAAAVAGFAVASTSEAATVVLSYTTVQYSASSVFASGVTTVPVTPGVGGAILLPAAGYYLRFNISAVVVGDSNAAFVAADATQPGVLGIASFGATVTSAVRGSASPVSTAGADIATGSTSSAVVNSVFGTTSKGIVAADGSIGTGALANLIAGGNVAGSIDNTDGVNNNKLTVGTGAGSTLFTGVRYRIDGAVALTVNFPPTSMAFITPGAAGSPPSYANRNFNPATDTVVGPGTIFTGPEPTSLTIFGVASFGLLARRRKA